MIRYRFLETPAGKITFGAFLFVMLLLARDTMITTAILGFTKSQFLMLGLICLFGLAFLWVNRKEWKNLLLDKRMPVFLISALILLLPMVLKRDWQMMYFSILICLFFAVFLTFFTSLRDVAKYYVVFMAALGVYSMIATYVLREFAQAGIWDVPVFYNASGWDFYNFGLCFSVTWELWHRNFGIFREPGVYQFFLLLALYLNNYAVSWKKDWQIWLVNIILAVTMVTTFAIGGYAETALLAVFVFFDQKWYRKKAGKVVIGLVLLAFAGVAVHFLYLWKTSWLEYSVYFELYDMFARLTTDSDSAVDRMDAILTNLRFIFQNPLVGNPLGEVLHGTNHNTSSTLILYAILGVAGGTLNVAAWIALTWKKERNLIANVILLGILFMSFNTQNLVADVFFWLFPYMALVEWILPKFTLSERKVCVYGTGTAEKSPADPAGNCERDQTGL